LKLGLSLAILNGRITPEFNNFTFVSSQRGSTVPDYIFCPADQLDYCTEAKVLLIREIVNMSGLQPPLNLPDHSIIKCTFETSSFNLSKNTRLFNEPAFNFETINQPKRPPRKYI
jgi:hypothetical protein